MLFNPILRFDEVRILSNNGSSVEKIISYSGHTVPIHRHLHSSNIIVQFTSDDSTEEKGFNISISFELKGTSINIPYANFNLIGS